MAGHGYGFGDPAPHGTSGEHSASAVALQPSGVRSTDQRFASMPVGGAASIAIGGGAAEVAIGGGAAEVELFAAGVGAPLHAASVTMNGAANWRRGARAGIAAAYGTPRILWSWSDSRQRGRSWTSCIVRARCSA